MFCCVRRRKATSVTSILWMTVALIAATGCQRPSASGPRHRPPTIAGAVPKLVLQKARLWDGSIALRHPDGSSTVAAWPLQIRVGDAEPEPVTQRCERISQGAPYVVSGEKGLVNPVKFESGVTAMPREFAMRAIGRGDPCSAELGPTWRLPSLEEFNGYAPHLAKAGAWIVRTRTGALALVDYSPPIRLRLARAVEIPALTRTALTNTGRVVCLREASAPIQPADPSREEIEHCVRRFFEQTDDFSVLLALRVACRKVASPSDWDPIVDELAAKVQLLVTALLDPNHLHRDPDEAVEESVETFLQTTRACLARPAHSREAASEGRANEGRANDAAVHRVDELQASIDSAHQKRIELRRNQRFSDDWRAPPAPSPEFVPQTAPKPRRCGCVQGDLACSMRCASKGQ